MKGSVRSLDWRVQVERDEACKLLSLHAREDSNGPKEPLLIKHAVAHWPACQQWTLQSLEARLSSHRSEYFPSSWPRLYKHWYFLTPRVINNEEASNGTELQVLTWSCRAILAFLHLFVSWIQIKQCYTDLRVSIDINWHIELDKFLSHCLTISFPYWSFSALFQKMMMWELKLEQ